MNSLKKTQTESKVIISVLIYKNAEATGGISILIFILKICFQTA